MKGSALAIRPPAIHGIGFVMLIGMMALGAKSSSNLFEPIPDAKVSSIYVNGQPFASVALDSGTVWLTLKKTHVADKPYLELWCLYENSSTSTTLLDPLTWFTLRSYAIDDSSQAVMRVESPAKILAVISEAEASRSIVTGIFGALATAASGLSAQPTTVYGTGALTGSGFVVNDAGEKAAAQAARTSEAVARSMNATREAYTALKQSLNQGVLRKNWACTEFCVSV